MVNPPRKAVTKKPLETGVARCAYFHVDCDPAEGESPDDAKKRHRASLYSGALPIPTISYDSGNGIVAWWKLASPIPLNSLSDIAECKANNVAIAEALGGKRMGV